jgi:hypothetical protein
VGYVLWALLLGAMLVLEGLGLTLKGNQWPTVSDLFRSMTRPVFGRWIFFAAWLWAGWHFFIRGWQFFLQGNGAQAPGRGQGGGKGLYATITQVCIPLIALFVAFFAIGRASRHMPVDENEAAEVDRASRTIVRRPLTFAKYAAVTSIGGYLLFIGVIALYRLVVGKSASGDFSSASSYGAFLGFVIGIPLFFAVSFAESAMRERRVRRSHAARSPQAAVSPQVASPPSEQ